MPGRYEQWTDFLAEVKQRGIDVIVCLAPNDEIERKSPSYAIAIRDGTLNCQRECFLISDYEIPQDREASAVFLRRIAELLRLDKTILVHCGAGIGRTGMFSICLLLTMGMSRINAEEAIHDAGSYPETASKEAWWIDVKRSSQQNTIAPNIRCSRPAYRPDGWTFALCVERNLR